MGLKNPIYTEFELNATTGNSRKIALTHTDDNGVDVIELAIKQAGRSIAMIDATVTARMVLHGKTPILINDSVPCSVNANGNIMIPFDNAVIQSRSGDVKVEVNITRDSDELTLQLPLWVTINGSILDTAEITEHSQGTIPELLQEVAQELEAVENKTFATIGSKVSFDLNDIPQELRRKSCSLYTAKRRYSGLPDFVTTAVDTSTVHYVQHYAAGKSGGILQRIAWEDENAVPRMAIRIIYSGTTPPADVPWREIGTYTLTAADKEEIAQRVAQLLSQT